MAIEDGYADPSTVGPGQEATCQVMGKDHPKIKRFKLLNVTWN